MPTNGNGSEPPQEEPKQYLVQCDGCSFEQPAEDRADATAIGTSHSRETRHEVVAIELPPARFPA